MPLDREAHAKAIEPTVRDLIERVIRVREHGAAMDPAALQRELERIEWGIGTLLPTVKFDVEIRVADSGITGGMKPSGLITHNVDVNGTI